MALDPALVAEVNERLFAPLEGARESLKKTDVGIIFGGRSTTGAAVREAIRLYYDGRFDHFILAGGARIFQPEVALALVRDLSSAILSPRTLRDIFTLATEADYMRQILLEHGVPEEKIIVASREERAHLIVRDVIQQDFKSATLIGYAAYTARQIGTFQKQGEERPLVPYPVNVFGLNPENWQDSKLALLVVREAHNTDPANPKGYIGTYCDVPDWEEVRRRNATLPDVSL